MDRLNGKCAEIENGLRNEWERLIRNEKNIYIYGAGAYGRRTLQLLERSNKIDCVRAFLVTSKTDNPDDILGIPVIEYKDVLESNALVLISVKKCGKKILRDIEIKSSFQKISLADKYLSLNRAYDSLVTTISIAELLEKQISSGRHCYDIAAKLKEIEYYYAEENFSGNFKRYFDDKDNLGRFIKLMDSWKRWGYDSDSEIVISENAQIIEGVGRVALAIYYGLSFLRVRIDSRIPPKKFDMAWCLQHFSKEECDDVKEKMKDILNRYSKLPQGKNSFREELYVLLGRNQDFSVHSFYQSLPSFGICGQRPTADRIELYGLEEIVKGKRVLDIGCNCGFLDISIAKWAKHIEAIEQNIILLKIANRVKEYLSISNIDFVCEDFNQYINNGKYDVVFSFAVHCWIGMDPQKYAHKLATCMNRNGILLFESHNMKDASERELYEKYSDAFKDCGFMLRRADKILDDGMNLREYRIFEYED